MYWVETRNIYNLNPKNYFFCNRVLGRNTKLCFLVKYGAIFVIGTRFREAYRLSAVFFGATRLLEALVRAYTLVGEPLAHLLGRYIRLLGQIVGHVVVRIGILLIFEEPFVQHVHYFVRKEAIHAARARIRVMCTATKAILSSDWTSLVQRMICFGFHLLHSARFGRNSRVISNGGGGLCVIVVVKVFGHGRVGVIIILIAARHVLTVGLVRVVASRRRRRRRWRGSMRLLVMHTGTIHIQYIDGLWERRGHVLWRVIRVVTHVVWAHASEVHSVFFFLGVQLYKILQDLCTLLYYF